MAETAKQDIEQLQQRYEEFKAKRVKYETQRDSALEELDSLKQQAQQLYGSDDIQQLEKMLEKMKAENEEKRAGYQAALDEVDRQLNAVEQQFASDQHDDQG